MVSWIDFDKLSETYGMSVEELKQKTYSQLEQMESDLQNKEILGNLKDTNFRDAVKKFLTCFDYLRQWFSEDEICDAACRNAGMDDLVEEKNFPVGLKCPYSRAEFLGTKEALVREYDKKGREYLYGTRKLRDVYLVPNDAQGSLCHGKIILDLLYGRYPQLVEFKFKAYSIGFRESEYEIYPANNIYTPFKALMEKDIEAIRKRNIEYAKFYNYDVFTIENVQKRLESNEAKKFFAVIQAM